MDSFMDLKTAVSGIYLSNLQTNVFSSLPLCTLRSSHHNLTRSTQLTQKQITCSVSTINTKHTNSAAARPHSYVVSRRPVSNGFLFIASAKSKRYPFTNFADSRLVLFLVGQCQRLHHNLHYPFSNNNKKKIH